MALSEQAEKLAEYRARLDAGHADRIAPSHVEQVIRKLEAKRAKLSDKLARATADGEQERLNRKIAKSDSLIEQARWLRDQL
ncbi:MAG: hypothetical protein ABR500_11715 [Dermatophilaceae bacterium]|nr:hypothetical protein [Intrasporangiaceae bacterium]